MIFKNILERLGPTWTKNVAGDMVRRKELSKQKTKVDAPGVVAGGDIHAGGDIVVGDKTIHHHAPEKKEDQLIARELVNFLENKRVLYDPHEWERTQDCIYAVFDIRGRIERLLDEQQPAPELELELKRIQAACRTFLTASQRPNYISGMEMRGILDTFRREVRPPVIKLVKSYGLGVGALFKKNFLERI